MPSAKFYYKKKDEIKRFHYLNSPHLPFVGSLAHRFAERVVNPTHFAKGFVDPVHFAERVVNPAHFAKGFADLSDIHKVDTRHLQSDFHSFEHDAVERLKTNPAISKALNHGYDVLKLSQPH